ncbi:MAG: hypothetical protein QW756_03445 [Nitrososphaerota archaeon]
MLAGLTALLLTPMAIQGLRDTFNHSITLGFIGNMIMTYAPILLPALINKHAPYKRLTKAPIL